MEPKELLERAVLVVKELQGLVENLATMDNLEGMVFQALMLYREKMAS